MTNKTEKYSLLYSPRQEHFHIEPLNKTVKQGVQTFLRGITQDYVLVGIFESLGGANSYAEELKERKVAISVESLSEY